MIKMVKNPYLTIRTLMTSGQLTNIQLAAPIRSKGLKISSFHPSRNEKMFETVCRLLNTETLTCFSNCELKNLQSVGALCKESSVPCFPRINCQVMMGLKYNNVNRKDLGINSSIQISTLDNPPDEVRRRSPNLLFIQAFKNKKRPTYWIKNWFTRSIWPYQFSRRTSSRVTQLLEGRISIDDLTQQEVNVFTGIGLLNHHDSFERELHIQNLKSEYQKKNSIHLQELICRQYHNFLKQYLKSLESEGFLRLGDYQTSSRYWAHNEAINRYVQSQLYEFISEIACSKWRPAFSYYASYQSGSTLKRHVDRSQAGLTISLMIDYGNKEGTKRDNWPIYVEKEENSDEYFEYTIGERNAALFNGNKYVHYRLPIKSGYYSRSMLFHFVPENFNERVL